MVYNVSMIRIKITENEKEQRLDRFLRKYYRNAPLSYIYKLLRTGVKVNGRRVPENTKLAEGDELIIDIESEEEKSYLARKKPLNANKDFTVAYEDENILVVEKPFGLLTHGDSNQRKETLANQVIGYLIETGSYIPRNERTFVPSPVNRLDRNTTGLVIFGKNADALRSLSQMLRDKDGIRRYYLALVHGELKEAMFLRGTMEKDESTNLVRIKGAQEESGKIMETRVVPLGSARGITLVEVEILTGRSHQIRVQLAEAGFPIVGDPKYGSWKADARIKGGLSFKAQCLHAGRIVFENCSPSLGYLKGRELHSKPPIWAKAILGDKR
jgi:23S rRNA pseudouridine955/2504/2580 synthase